MVRRLRLAAAAFVLSAALVFALLGVFSASASLEAKGRVISAKLTPKATFTVAQAKTTRLVCKFSPASKRVVFLLQVKKGSKWAKVQSTTKKGSIKTSTTTVKKLFGSKSVTAGTYRVKISADANSLTRKFTISGGSSSSDGSSSRVPGAFSKTSPTNGATNQASPVNLEWSSSSGADSYEYCVDTTDNNDCDNEWISTDSATNGSYRARAHGAALYWQVRAINAEGTTYADGGTWFSFTVAP